jgi:hypothetical protein
MSIETTDTNPTTARIHQVVPLTEWIRGTAVLHFTGGNTVTRKMSFAEAQSLHGILGNTRSSDRLDWADLGWIQFTQEVDACEFKADEDLGWPLTADERTALTAHGHPHGILRTLRDHWKARGTEPSYSPFTLWQLHWAALDGLTGTAFTTLANLYEGEKGDRLVQDALDNLKAAEESTIPTRPRRPSKADLQVDDMVEPEDAPPAVQPEATGPAPDGDMSTPTEAPTGTSAEGPAGPRAPDHAVEDSGSDDDLNLN